MSFTTLVFEIGHNLVVMACGVLIWEVSKRLPANPFARRTLRDDIRRDNQIGLTDPYLYLKADPNPRS